MATVKPRGKVPKQASVGEIIEIKTLLRHPMHSGRMRDAAGEIIPRKIVNKFYVLLIFQYLYVITLYEGHIFALLHRLILELNEELHVLQDVEDQNLKLDFLFVFHSLLLFIFSPFQGLSNSNSLNDCVSFIGS